MKITREGTRPFSNVVLSIDGKRIGVSSCSIRFEGDLLKIKVETKKGIVPREQPKEHKIYTKQPTILGGIAIDKEKKKIFPLDEDAKLQLSIERKKVGVKIVKGLSEEVDLISDTYNVQNFKCIEQAIEDLVKQEKKYGKISMDKYPVAVFKEVQSNYFVLFERILT